MTVAPLDAPAAALAAPQRPTTDLEGAVRRLANAKTFADAVCPTPLVPQAYRDKAADAAVAILFGAELGLEPMQSLQQVVVTNGSPGLYARAAVALVVARGHHVWVETSTPDLVVVAGRNRHWPASVPDVREEWTIDRAKAAGYYSRNKVNYDGKPQEMLYARGAMNVARRIDPGALLGLPMSVEELRDGGDMVVEGEVIHDRPAYIPSPSPAPDVPATGKETLPTPLITGAQSRALHAALRDLGLADRSRGLAWISQILGYEVTSTRHLTTDEAASVIDNAREAARLGFSAPDAAPAAGEAQDGTAAGGLEGDPADSEAVTEGEERL